MMSYETATDYAAEKAAMAARIPAYWKVAAFSAVQMYDGVAFTATVTRKGRPVARLENDGHGGPDTLYWTEVGSEAEAEWQKLVGRQYEYEEQLAADALLTRCGY